MKRIVIEVEDQIARAWRAASPAKKKEINLSLETQLSKQLSRDEIEDYKSFLVDLREKMASRGLTQELLDEILNE